MPAPHRPPFTITPRLVGLVAEVCERLGAWGGGKIVSSSPRLRRENRVRGIHASLAIGKKSLTPVESLIRERQVEATPFAEFMLEVIGQTLAETAATEADQVTDQVKALPRAFGSERELSAEELLRRLNLRHKPTLRKNHLTPALDAGLLEMTRPDSPRSPTQRCRLTVPGARSLKSIRS